MYYFDPSGKSFSIPNGLQNYIEGKMYQFMILTYFPVTNSYYNVTYSISIRLPSGQTPLVSIKYKLNFFFN